jgi:hypothetical protein
MAHAELGNNELEHVRHRQRHRPQWHPVHLLHLVRDSLRLVRSTTVVVVLLALAMIAFVGCQVPLLLQP